MIRVVVTMTDDAATRTGIGSLAREYDEGAIGSIEAAVADLMALALQEGLTQDDVRYLAAGRGGGQPRTSDVVRSDGTAWAPDRANVEIGHVYGTCNAHIDVHYFRNDPDPCIGWRDYPAEQAEPYASEDAAGGQ